MTLESFQYRTSGTCSSLINVVLEGEIVKDVLFIGGCSGNLKGICELVKGMKIDEVIEKLQGISCGSKSTSCPDQLSQCLTEIKKRSVNKALK